MDVQTTIRRGHVEKLLHNKYLKNKTLAQSEGKPTDSPFFGKALCV
jgi:hypothetical protein